MNRLRCMILLQFATTLALGQSAHQSKSPSLPKQPEAIVRSLYREVVARHPLGALDDAEVKIFAPYLSKALIHRMDLASACGGDWYRQNPERDLKPELGWLELGPFSGENERSSPQTFFLERTQFAKDGSFRVYVRLTRAYSDVPPSIWRIAAIVIREDGHFVVDDVIYLKDQDYDEGRLSEGLSAGCDGPRWIGFGDQQKGEKQQKK